MGICDGRGKRSALVKKGKGPVQRNVVKINFEWIICKEKKHENGQTLTLFFHTAFFRHIFKKSTRSLFGAWSFLLVHIQFTSSKRPNLFVNGFIKKSDHEVGPMRKAIYHDPRGKPAWYISITNGISREKEIKVTHSTFPPFGPLIDTCQVLRRCGLCDCVLLVMTLWSGYDKSSWSWIIKRKCGMTLHQNTL